MQSSDQFELPLLGQRLCRRCGETKSLTEFHLKGERRDSRCRTCVSQVKAAARKRKKALTGTIAKRRRNSRVLDVSQMTVTCTFVFPWDKDLERILGRKLYDRMETNSEAPPTVSGQHGQQR